MSGREITVHEMADAAIFIDENGVIEQANPAFETLSGWTERQLIGQPLQWLYAASAEGTERAAQSDGPPTFSENDEQARTHRYRRRTGGSFWGETIAFSLSGEEGASKGTV